MHVLQCADSQKDHINAQGSSTFRWLEFSEGEKRSSHLFGDHLNSRKCVNTATPNSLVGSPHSSDLLPLASDSPSLLPVVFSDIFSRRFARSAGSSPVFFRTSSRYFTEEQSEETSMLHSGKI